MVRFKVGDIVTGNANSNYGITNWNMTKGEVIRIHEDDSQIDVKVLEHATKNKYIGQVYSWLDEYKFDLVSNKKEEIVTTKEEKIMTKATSSTPKGTLRGVVITEEKGNKFVVINKQVTLCIDSNGKVGASVCGKNDTFDEEIGKALAFYRLANK